MTSRSTSLLIVLGTLVVGIAIGALATGAIMNNRLDELEALRMQGGVQSFLERGIQPVDDAQRERIRQAIEGVESRQMELRRRMFQEHRILFDSLRAELDVILTDDQKEQLSTMMTREREQFKQRRGRGDGPPPFPIDGAHRRGDRHRDGDSHRGDQDSDSTKTP
ncbi:MAG: hypothetical protein SH809_03675 [Rhodothermales bacterium]|nr:hypothetical protein [Rhodothermales bacterium]